ncbi:MAG: hypothetical protein R3B06_27600 [Kofleriaceae bacterium]
MRTAALLLTTTLATSLGACGGDDVATPDAPTRPTVFGGARPVELQVPRDFDPAKTYPLLIILHGYGASGFLQQGYFKLNDVADTGQLLVLAPDGTTDASGKQFWNADPTCCDFGGADVDDVAYVGGLIDDVQAAWPVAQVALLGHSNGAFMAYRMACERADVIGAIAGLAGHATSLPCTPTRPVSVLHIHGTMDETVPYESGTFNGVPSPGAVDSVAAWATRNGCTGTPATAGTKDLVTNLAGAETTVSVTGGCPADGAADLWSVADGMHIPNLSAGFPTELLGWLAAHPR